MGRAVRLPPALPCGDVMRPCLAGEPVALPDDSNTKGRPTPGTGLHPTAAQGRNRRTAQACPTCAAPPLPCAAHAPPARAHSPATPCPNTRSRSPGQQRPAVAHGAPQTHALGIPGSVATVGIRKPLPCSILPARVILQFIGQHHVHSGLLPIRQALAAGEIARPARQSQRTTLCQHTCHLPVVEAGAHF